MERGYLKLWRKSLESVVFNNPEVWKLWCWCLVKASYKKRWKSVVTGRGETEVEILPGQFIYGRKTAAKALRMNESTIRNRMEKLKKMGKIDIKPDTHYSIVTICNWESFQSEEDGKGQAKGQPKDNQRTTKGHKQEGKEGKEGKNNIPFLEIVSSLNEKIGKNYKPTTASTKKHILARWNEGFVLDDFKKVIDIKCGEWKDDDKMSKFLRPETLFGSKFEGYLNSSHGNSHTAKIDCKKCTYNQGRRCAKITEPGFDVLTCKYFKGIENARKT